MPGQVSSVPETGWKGQSFTGAFHFHNADYFWLCRPDRRRYFHETKESYRAPMKFTVKKNEEVMKTHQDHISKLQPEGVLCKHMRFLCFTDGDHLEHIYCSCSALHNMCSTTCEKKK